MGAVADVASNIFVGPGGDQLTGTEKATRIIETILAGSQNAAGIINARQSFAAQNAAAQAFMQTPEFQGYPPDKQTELLQTYFSGYKLPGMLPPVSNTEQLQSVSAGSRLQQAGGLSEGSPDRNAALGIPTLPSGRGAEAAATLTGAHKAGLTPEEFTMGPGGVSLGGEAPAPWQRVPPERIDEIAAKIDESAAGFEGMEMREAPDGVYVRGLSPAMAKRRDIANLSARADAMKASLKLAEGARTSSDALSTYANQWKELAAAPGAFSMDDTPPDFSTGARGALQNFIWQHGPEYDRSVDRQRLINQVNGDLDAMLALYGGAKGVLTNEDIDRARAGLTTVATSRKEFLAKVDREMKVLQTKVMKAEARVGGSGGGSKSATAAEPSAADSALKERLRAKLKGSTRGPGNE